MKIFRTIKELQDELHQYRNGSSSIGFVPTMGALHEGHLSLVRRSVTENPVTITSVFVNPTQFNNPNDLANYPRTEEADVKMLEESKCTVVFIPSTEEIYPKKELLDINFGLMETTMEGEFRPGHFKGVATVVNKLFQIVQPDVAYFGKKDFQQLAIIRSMVKQLKIKIKIIGCSTVREKDGLAMSSRNIHLTKEERSNASVIYQALLVAKEEYSKNFSVGEITNHAIEKIEGSRLFRVQYFKIVNAETLRPNDEITQKITTQACIAVLTSKTRLIDNIALNGAQQN